MPWEVRTTEEFDRWFASLTDKERRMLAAPMAALQEEGPELGRPYVDSVQGSRHSNMKELRKKANPIRAFFAFDPERRAILLIGGRKDGSKGKRFYETMIATADDLLDKWLATIEQERKREGERKKSR